MEIEQCRIIEKRLNDIYKKELIKIKESVEDSIKSDSSRGISQKIGRRFGHLWEVLVKETISSTIQTTLGEKIFYKEYIDGWININVRNKFNECCIHTSENILKKFLSEDTDIDKQGLCDFTLIEKDTIYAIDTKFSLSSNDGPKVKTIANSGKQLEFLNYKPVLLFRTEKIRQFTFNRFSKNGWNIICGKNSSEWILHKTGFDLGQWIDDNIDIWTDLSDYHKDLKKLRTNKEDWKF